MVEKINISGVPETMLQTLYARAVYSQRREHKFYDAKALEIVSRMDYDFTNAGKDAIMSNGVIARTILLDSIVDDFIRKNPNCTIITIACGLDMRCYRLDNDKIQHIKEKSIKAAQAKFTWGVKTGKELEQYVPRIRWIKDVSLAEGMIQMMPANKLVAWIPLIRNISNKLTILEV